MSRRKKLEVSIDWKGLAQKATWPQIFKETVAKYPDKEALVFPETGRRFTYSEYHHQIAAVAQGLRAVGVRKGTHVGVWMTNQPEWCFLRWAIYSVGAIMVPLHTRYKSDELEYVLKQSDTEVLVLEEKFLGRLDALGVLLGLAPEIESQQPGELRTEAFPSLRSVIVLGEGRCSGAYDYAEIMSPRSGEAVDIATDSHSSKDPIHIIYTSGTTGFPKGVVTPSSCNVAFCAISTDLYSLYSNSVYLNCMPFFGNIGLWNLALPILVGAKLVVGPANYDPRMTGELIERERVTHAIFVPTMLIDLLNQPDLGDRDLSSLERITCSGAPVPQALIQMAKKKLGLALMNIYGLSEASGLSTWVPYGDTPEHVELTVGLPMPHCEVGILDPATGEVVTTGTEGEICTRETFPGSQHMLGYYKQPELTAEVVRDGWLHSGDLGMMDADGYVYLTGRLKDMYTVGGFNVSPAEVENCLLKHEKVANAAVVGVPDERLGEVGAAFIILRDGVTADQEEIVDYCKERIANIKVPRYVWFVDSLPTNPQGKVQKFKLREDAAGRFAI